MTNALTGESEPRLLYEYAAWRQDTRTMADVGAFRTVERNVIVGNAAPEPTVVAEITASALRLSGVAPIVGRPLLDADERPGAPGVVVLGCQAWQRWFGGRLDALGRTLQL